MGNTPAEQPITYTSIKKHKHQILGHYQLVQAHFANISQQCILRKRTHLDIQRINKDVTVMTGRENNKACKHVYKKVYAQQGRTQNYCSNFKQQEVFYECFQQDLQEQYLSKKGHNLSFQQDQILAILKDCLLALKLGEDLHFRYYHISKKSILKNKSGAYMLIKSEDSELQHPLLDYVDQFSSQILTKNYCLSPQLLLSITEIIGNEPNLKDHIFSLGATLLSLCLMKQIQLQSETVSFTIHNNQKKIYFPEKLLKNQVQKLKNLIKEINYSDKLKSLLEGMIYFDIQKRFAIQKLQALLEETQKPKVKKIATRKLSFSSSKNTKENIQTMQTCKTIRVHAPSTHSRNNSNIYLDALPILENQKNVIANDAKNYKNAKILKFKHQTIPCKQVVSRMISNHSVNKDYTPIKNLSPFKFQTTNSKDGTPYDLPITESCYELYSEQNLKLPISKTSIACINSKAELLAISKSKKIV